MTDRDGLLDGAGVGVDAGELDEAAVVLGMLVVPEVLQRIEELVASRRRARGSWHRSP